MSCPAAWCLDTLTWGRSTGDGQYYIDPANTGSATAVTCDMANGGWTLACGDVGDPIVQDVPAAVRAIPITEVRGTPANGTTSTLPYDLAGQDLDAMYNSPWIYTGFEQDNYTPLGDGPDQPSSIYLMDDHHPTGGCTYNSGPVRQTQQPETPRGSSPWAGRTRRPSWTRAPAPPPPTTAIRSAPCGCADHSEPVIRTSPLPDTATISFGAASSACTALNSTRPAGAERSSA